MIPPPAGQGGTTQKSPQTALIVLSSERLSWGETQNESAVTDGVSHSESKRVGGPPGPTFAGAGAGRQVVG